MTGADGGIGAKKLHAKGVGAPVSTDFEPRAPGKFIRPLVSSTTNTLWRVGLLSGAVGGPTIVIGSVFSLKNPFSGLPSIAVKTAYCSRIASSPGG